MSWYILSISFVSIPLVPLAWPRGATPLAWKMSSVDSSVLCLLHTGLGCQGLLENLAQSHRLGPLNYQSPASTGSQQSSASLQLSLHASQRLFQTFFPFLFFYSFLSHYLFIHLGRWLCLSYQRLNRSHWMDGFSTFCHKPFHLPVSGSILGDLLCVWECFLPCHSTHIFNPPLFPVPS